MDIDVLVVGAGPTGLMLANQLARCGIRPVIIDRHAGPAQQTRAMGVQARTLEIYAKLGIAQQALERGAVTAGANIWAQARHKARLPLGEAGQGLSPFPFVLMLGQDDNERILGARLDEAGVSVRWNTELTALGQHDDHVTATLRQPDGSLRDVEARWVAGCDGARSSVRELCGITFPGAPYEHVFFVADTVATGDMVPDELNVYLWREGFHLFFPMRGKDGWRVIGILPQALRDREDLGFDELVPYLGQEAGARLSFERCHWFSTYHIHHRSASRFRDRRCFLLGDAAHIHSPMGAQGMNTGLQDAYNLAWKLALVVQEEAEECVLESYEAERQPVAQRLLDTTDRAFRFVVSDTPTAALLRTWIVGNVAAVAMRRPRVQRLAFMTISQIGIRYPQSPLSRDLPGLPPSAPRAGDRFPWLQFRAEPDGPLLDLFERLDDRRFNLVIVGDAAADAAAVGVAAPGGRLKLHHVPGGFGNDRALARAGLVAPSFYLLRPDGHVGVAGITPDATVIADYFEETGLAGVQMLDTA